MNLVADTIPVRPQPPKKIPGLLKIIRSINGDLIGAWPEPAYHMKAYMLKMGRYSVYIANSPQTVQHVFVNNNRNYNRKSIFMRNALEPLLGDGLFISDGDVWQARRDMEAPAFKATQLRNFAKIMTDCALEWSRRWEVQYPGKNMFMLTEMASLTAEVLCRCLFGKQLGMDNSHRIIKGFSRYQATIRHVDLAAVFGLPKWFHRKPRNHQAMVMARQIHDVVDEIITAQLNNPGEKQSLLAQMLGYYRPDDPDSISLQQIRNEIVVLLMAGHETTANSLSWSWYLLSQHPRVAERLQQELDTVLGDRPPTFDDVARLPYTRAVFEEALRLYPPVPILSREAIGDDQVGKFRVPKGTLVVVAPWLLHRHADYWEYPHHFVPERFTGEWSSKNTKYTYIPFSIGPRNCLGAAFGLIEAVLCLAVLAQKFRPQLQPGYRPWYECRLTLRPSESLPMIASLR